MERNHFEQQVSRAYIKDFLPAVVGYCAITLAVTLLVDFDTAGPWKYLVAFLPVLAALWGARAMGRQLDRIDELARRDMTTAMAVGFGAAMITAMTMAFMNIAGLDSRYWGAWAIYGAGMAGWSIAGIRLQARNG